MFLLSAFLKTCHNRHVITNMLPLLVQTSGYLIAPEVQVVFAGETAFIKCTLPHAKWKKKEGVMPPQVSITENGISLFKLTVKDTGNYTCYQTKIKFTVESLTALVIVGGILLFPVLFFCVWFFLFCSCFVLFFVCFYKLQ